MQKRYRVYFPYMQKYVTFVDVDGYVAYKCITLPCIPLMFIEMKFIHSHCVIFTMKSMSLHMTK